MTSNDLRVNIMQTHYIQEDSFRESWPIAVIKHVGLVLYAFRVKSVVRKYQCAPIQNAKQKLKQVGLTSNSMKMYISD